MIKNYSIAWIIASTAILANCHRQDNPGAALAFSDDALSIFEGQQQDNLGLGSIPLFSAQLATERGSLGTLKDYYFRLKFFKVEYAELGQKVNGSTEGDVTNVIDVHREMVISRDNLEGGHIAISPIYDNSYLIDGYYMIVMCRNASPCEPPAAATLTQYKNLFQSGAKCQGIGSESCKETLFADSATDHPFLGIVYPVTVAAKKFTAGDNDISFIAGSASPAGLGLADVSTSTAIWESSGNGYEPVNGNAFDSGSPAAPGKGNLNAGTGGTPDNGNFWETVGKVLIWLNTTGASSGGGNTAAANAQAAAGVAAANAAAAAAAAAGARAQDCFVAGTRIAVVAFAPDGSILAIGEKPIEEITVGEYVYNPLLRSAFQVKKLYRQDNYDPIYTIQVISSAPEVNLDLTVSAAHPVITKVGIKPVALLAESDKVLLVNKIPVTSQSDYSWFSVKKLLKTTIPGTVKIYNMDVDQNPIPVGQSADASPWHFTVSRDDPACQAKGCSANFLSSNQIVSGDLAKQAETEKMLQTAFVNINNTTPQQ